MNPQVEFRSGTREDVPLILEFIRAIASYEKMTDQVEAAEASLEKWMFTERVAEVIFAVVDGKEVGFALFHHNFSTFVGRAGIHLEDIYVNEEYRRQGLGRAMFMEVVRIAKERGCGRMEWECLNWNEPAIEFYLSLEARPLAEWTTYRLDQEDIDRLLATEA